MTTRVILVRHGQSTYNLNYLIQGQTDSSALTDLGQQQAARVGQTLSGVPIDHIYASPLQRAFTTAQIATATLRQSDPTLPQPEPAPILKEIDLPPWEGLSFKEAEAKDPEQYHNWFHDPLNFRFILEGGRELYPVRDLYDRATQFWQTTLPRHPDQTLLIVAHSAINRALIATALGLGPTAHETLHQANCAISVLNFSGTLGDKMQLESMNLTSHMGDPLVTMRSRHRGPRILLVRHGETEWNRQQRFQGQIDIPLNDNGRSQGEKAAEFLRAIPIDAAVTSPLSRPKETAELILRYHPQVTLTEEPGLKEIGHGDWEGLYESEIEAKYPGMLAQWQRSPETVTMPGAGGETLAQVWERAGAAWRAIVAAHSQAPGEPAKTILVTAHDAVNKAILCQIVGLGPDSFWKFKQGNGAVSVIDYPDGPDSRPVLMAANITIHLSGTIFDRTAAGAL